MSAPTFKLSQSQKQTLKISPAQIQLLNFLQLNTLELEQHLKNELEENPLLEEATESATQNDDNAPADDNDRTQEFMDWDEFGHDDTPDYRTRLQTNPDDEYVFAPTLTEATTWRHELKEQFLMLPLTERQHFLAVFVIDSLTDEGYLHYTAEAIADDVSFSNGLYVEEPEVQEILDLLKRFEPVGLGARNLQECLLRQLEQHPADDTTAHATLLIDQHLDDLAARNYDKIKRITNLSTDQLKAAIARIGTLNRKPIVDGSNETLPVKDNIIPDYVLRWEGSGVEVELNTRHLPALKVNNAYADAVGHSRAANNYVSSKLNAANWLIEAILQREQTMLKAMRTIVKLQEAYLKTGDERQLKPMILKDVAERIQMDISTVSRVTSGKYAQTPFGTIHLKDLFTEGIMSDEGEEVSNRKIQLALAELIQKEDKQQPLNDFQLADLLAAQGFRVARRTVAKYREQLGIPSAQMRAVL